MTVTVANTSNTNTFDYWRTRTNELAYAMSNYVLSTGSATVGNAALNGTFTVGNSSSNSVINSTSFVISNTSANIAISLPTVAQISNGQLYLNANGSWLPAKPAVTSLTANGPTTLLVDSFPIATNKTAEYLVSVVDNVDNNYYSSKMLVLHNGTSAYITEYAALTSNTSVGVFSVTTNTTHVILNFDAVSTNANVSFTRIIV